MIMFQVSILSISGYSILDEYTLPPVPRYRVAQRKPIELTLWMMIMIIIMDGFSNGESMGRITQHNTVL